MLLLLKIADDNILQQLSTSFRMKSKHIFILLLAVWNQVKGQADSSSLATQLHAYFKTLTTLKQFNGNVLVAIDDNILLNQTYNMDTAIDSLKVNHNSKFIIASVSKIFIKYALLKLVELNKLELTDSVSKYIPDFPNGSKITIEHLVKHQSGLPRELSGNHEIDTLSLAKIIAIAKTEKLQFEPGTQTLYSNVGYFLLHYIIEKTASDGYAAFMHDAIFKPMGLNNTTELHALPANMPFVYGFDNVDGTITATSKANLYQTETGNYLSTISDLHAFSKSILNEKNLPNNLALKIFGSDSLLVQAGGRPGYRAYFYLNPKTKTTFIFACNYSDIPMQKITTDVINMLAGKPYEMPVNINRKAIDVPLRLLQKYAGNYVLEADISKIITIKFIGNKLYNVDDTEQTELFADSANTFFENPNSNDGYVFKYNPQTQKYDLTIVFNGMPLKTKRQ